MCEVGNNKDPLIEGVENKLNMTPSEGVGNKFNMTPSQRGVEIFDFGGGE